MLDVVAMMGLLLLAGLFLDFWRCNWTCWMSLTPWTGGTPGREIMLDNDDETSLDFKCGVLVALLLAAAFRAQTHKLDDRLEL